MPLDFDLVVYQGEEIAVTLDLTDPLTGDPVDLSGGTFAARLWIASNPSVATPTVDDTDAATGRLVVELSATDTEQPPSREYRLEVRRTSAPVLTLAMGRIDLRDSAFVGG
jgi:hypothetical protein